MTKVDLITGFLGAGKTTFLLRYAKYMLRQGRRIAILVFDRGAVNVKSRCLPGPATPTATAAASARS